MINPNDYPSASKTSPRNVRTITENGSRVRQSQARKFLRSIPAEDRPSIGEYVLYDIVVPAIRSIISEVVRGATEQFLFGGARRGQSNTYGGHSSKYVSYNRTGDSGNRASRISYATKNNDVDDFIVDDRGTAIEVTTQFTELIENTGFVSVADLCSMVGVQSKYTDNKWGWTTPLAIRYERTIDDRFRLILQNPEPINK